MELSEICTICTTSTSRIRELDAAGPLCTTATAAEKLGITPSSLRIWRRLGKGPRFLRLRVGKRSAVIYSLADLQEFALAEFRDHGLLKSKRGAR